MLFVSVTVLTILSLAKSCFSQPIEPALNDEEIIEDVRQTV